MVAMAAPSGRVSMSSWLHSRMCRRATLPRHAQLSAKLKRISMKPKGDVQANSNELNAKNRDCANRERGDRERYETSVHFPLPAGTMARNYSEGDAAEHMERRWRCTIRRGQ